MERADCFERLSRHCTVPSVRCRLHLDNRRWKSALLLTGSDPRRLAVGLPTIRACSAHAHTARALSLQVVVRVLLCTLPKLRDWIPARLTEICLAGFTFLHGRANEQRKISTKRLPPTLPEKWPRRPPHICDNSRTRCAALV